MAHSFVEREQWSEGTHRRKMVDWTASGTSYVATVETTNVFDVNLMTVGGTRIASFAYNMSGAYLVLSGVTTTDTYVLTYSFK